MSGEPLDWSDGAPRSPRFGDIYFSAVDGLAESRAVFLSGCGLPEAWAERRRFTVGELGFGTGLNILALIDLWRRTRPAGGHLHVFSVEGFPIGREDAARALAAWPELADIAGALLAQWPDGRRGFHRIEWPDCAVTLDLAVRDVAEALQSWGGRADAWFLDGFAPAANPGMWSEEILGLVGQRSASGARAATFTVAGAVRRGLEAAGFTVEKRPGYGRKRERLEARRPGRAPDDGPEPRVAIIGAGIAGAALARAFRALGAAPTVFEPRWPGAGASGNPAALIAPRLDAGLGPVAGLSAQAFARAVDLYDRETSGAVIASGAVQLERAPKDSERFARLAAWDGFGPGDLTTLGAGETAAALGETAAGGGLLILGARVIEPAGVLARWLTDANLVRATVAGLESEGDLWRLRDGEGASLGCFGIVCLAAGPAVSGLVDLPLRITRGQASWADIPFSGVPAAWGGYAVPTRTGTLFGATHDRDDPDIAVRAGDHRRNLETLAKGRPALAERLAEATLDGRAGVRASTPDHLPLAGAVPDRPGLFVLAGLGGRGFGLAPLLAEQVVALALRAPHPLPRDLAATVAPSRRRD